jgi:hypothetical protein
LSPPGTIRPPQPPPRPRAARSLRRGGGGERGEAVETGRSRHCSASLGQRPWSGKLAKRDRTAETWFSNGSDNSNNSEPTLSTFNTPILPLAVFDCSFLCDEDDALPGYAGSAWRGAFGRALKRAVCVARDTECPACLLYRSCVYPYAFETPPPPDARKMRRYTAAPHPFVLRIDPRQSGSPYRLGLTLLGRADRHLPYFIHALAEAGKAGLGRKRRPFELIEVRQAAKPGAEDWRSIYAPGEPLKMAPGCVAETPPLPDWLEIRLETPLRLRSGEHLVTPADFRFAELFRPLLRRISMLTYFHTDTPLEADFAALGRSAREVPVHEPRLRWYDWTRYSSRQGTTMEMGGLLGHFRVRGGDVEPFWPYLWLGQWTHAGKGATMGMGSYRILPASLPDRA